MFHPDERARLEGALAPHHFPPVRPVLDQHVADPAQHQVFKVAAGGTAAELKVWHAQIANNYIDAAVTGAFLVLVLIVVAANARVWWQLLSGRRPVQLREETYVPLATATVVK